MASTPWSGPTLASEVHGPEEPPAGEGQGPAHEDALGEKPVGDPQGPEAGERRGVDPDGPGLSVGRRMGPGLEAEGVDAELRQARGEEEARRPAADDQDLGVHGHGPRGTRRARPAMARA